MNVPAVIETLVHEGIGLELSVRAKGELTDAHRALIREHRDGLLEHLARERVGETRADGALHTLLVWAARNAELRLEHPLPGDRRGLVLYAKPEHITAALERYPWGVVHDYARAVLFIWGDPPRDVLEGKCDPETDLPLVPESVAS